MKSKTCEQRGKVSADLARKLTAYSATAGAVLAMGAPAEAAIHVFTPPAPLTIDSSTTVSIDMDRDGVDDFTFSRFFTYYAMGFYSGESVMAIKVYRNNPADRFDADAAGNRAHRLAKGSYVYATLDQDEAKLMGARAYCTQDAYSHYHCSPPQWSTGSFNRGAQGYLGVKFRGHDGRDHNGWILFEGGTDPAHLSGSILGWAYEDSSGSIKAGADSSKASLTVLPSLDGNNAKEFAFLQEKLGTGFQTSILIKDTVTGRLIKEIACLDTHYRPVSLVRIDDLLGAGDPGLAVLAVRENASGKPVQVKVQLRDPRSGYLIRDVFFDRAYSPTALFWLPDMNGNGSIELALLGRNLTSGRSVVQIKDSESGALVKNMTVSLNSRISSVALWAIPDLNGNGSWELAVLQRDVPTGLSQIKVVDTLSGWTLKAVPCLDSSLTPLGLAWVRDLNGNGYPELGILAALPSGGRPVVEIKDMLTGQALRRVYFNLPNVPQSLAAADILGNRDFELAILGTNAARAVTQIEIRDSRTGAWLKTVSLQ